MHDPATGRGLGWPPFADSQQSLLSGHLPVGYSVKRCYHAMVNTDRDCAEWQGANLVADLLNIEIIATLNQAFCHLHHYRFCPHSEQLLLECSKV
jgi:hypothetical protein